MNRQEFFSLIDKWMEGSASEEEVQSLMNYYHSFKSSTNWDESQLGAKSLLEAEMEQQLLEAIRAPRPDATPVKRIWWPKIAAAAGLLLVLVTGWWYFSAKPPEGTVAALHVITTKAGEHKKVKLPDSTTVWLSPSSSISYTSVFDIGSRDVDLSGEAFFEVTTAAGHPFIIHSGMVSTRVLGTSFNVKAFETQPDVAITVLTGKVSVASGNAAVPVSPSERAIFSKATGKIITESGVDTTVLLNRRKGILKYDGAGIPEVLAELGYYYDVKIEISGKTTNCFYFGEFNTNSTLEKALNQLCLSLNATYEKNGTKYLIRKEKEC
ncbi:FecR family protein [Chitinophaga arvensicola]|uniref:Ferric-dicitrate binding protein FerR, regulates iron transport through sigma-19 n=1 Tax=Chitinophaga arvensicola TaxID=29529 RepID=A0A1I0SCX4_9BACT|nr:FecR family protein [Chitinophaga arvensicola]SEW55062.1 protein of unknown function [Chitinophaga arvensicola]